MLAVATIFAAALTVLPSAVQDAQANPCSTEVEQDTEVDADTATTSSSSTFQVDNDNREWNFNGPVELDED
jgi:hypothetical protein